MRAALLAGLFAMIAGCAPRASEMPSRLAGSDGETHDVRALARAHRAVVVTFFSPACPCQSAHDDRLRALATAYRDRDVLFFSVDSEADATVERDAREARIRRYPFPILTDPDGAMADALDAHVATYTVVLDSRGKPRFRGGIDSDRKELTSDAEPWLANALDAALRGDKNDLEEKRALGCSLRRK